MVGLITANNETAYREEIRNLEVWCQDNNLSLNVIKTKGDDRGLQEMEGQARPNSHRQGCSGAGLELKVPGCPHQQQTIMIQTHKDSREEGTTTPIEKIWHGSSEPQKVTAAPSRASLLVASPPGMANGLSSDRKADRATEGSAYGPVHHWGQASCHSGSLYQAVSEEGP